MKKRRKSRRRRRRSARGRRRRKGQRRRRKGQRRRRKEEKEKKKKRERKKKFLLSKDSLKQNLNYTPLGDFANVNEHFLWLVCLKIVLVVDQGISMCRISTQYFALLSRFKQHFA